MLSDAWHLFLRGPLSLCIRIILWRNRKQNECSIQHALRNFISLHKVESIRTTTFCKQNALLDTQGSISKCLHFSIPRQRGVTIPVMLMILHKIQVSMI